MAIFVHVIFVVVMAAVWLLLDTETEPTLSSR